VTCDLFAYILLVWFYVVRWFVPVATHGHLTSPKEKKYYR
jgi:hypothetical protein